MSREAKIGLLVSLAFLLVIGLLLSDHVTTATREPPAPLISSADDVRRGLTTPGQQMTGVVLPEQRQEEAPRPYVHTEAVTGHDPFRDEIPTINVQRGTLDPVIVADNRQQPLDPGRPTDWDNRGGPAPVPVDPFQHLRDAGEQGGAPIVQVNDPAPVVRVADYEAKKGDTLSRIAAKFLGRDSAENRQKIVALNPQLAANPNLIRVGQSYKVPTDGGATLAVNPTPPITPPTTTPPAGAKTYTVKPGDVLSLIAQRQLGSSRRVDDILKLNSDVLSDPDDLTVGMVLKLPA